MECRPQRAAFFWTALSSALAAACLNLGVSALAHPRAFEAWGRLGMPLAAGFVGLLVAAGLVFGLLGWLGRRIGLAPRPLDAGLQVGFVLAAALAPMVEVGLREASAERSGVVLACAAGFVGCAALAAYALAARRDAPDAFLRGLRALPWVSAVILGTLWFIEYRAHGGVGRAAVLLTAMVGIGGLVRIEERLASRTFMTGLAALVLLCGPLDLPGRPGGASPASGAGTELTPVVLITVDTLRTDRVLGNDAAERVPTPAIDALAADSVVFTQARSAAPWTKPSLATLVTGLPPLVHGMTNRRARMPEEIETLAERLKAAGYHTGGIGLNAHLERAFRFDQGFDDYSFPARADYGIGLGSKLLERWAPERYPGRFPSTTAIADAAVDWIGAHAQEPFFLWMHVLDPHWPYEPPVVWVEDPDKMPRRWGDPDMVTNVQAGNTKPGLAERERVSQLYAGEIRYVDDELARVVAALREAGLYERALIVFASDHGEEFWEHGHYEHGHTLYDEVLRVPLFFKLPGVGPRARLDAAVSTQAMLPTLLEVLGLPFDGERLGSRSLVPWWRSPEVAVEEPLFAGGTYYFGEKHAVVFDGRKLVFELDTGRLELFDLDEDPGEIHSLVAALPEARARGLELLKDWQERCADLRERLGIVTDSMVQPSDEILRTLEDLGYGGGE